MTKVTIERRLKHTEQRNPRHPWSIANRFYYTQMLPLIRYVNASRNAKPSIFYPYPQLFNKTFKKYLVISCVSLIDRYMTRLIRKYIDEQHIDISKLELNLNYETMLVKYPKITRKQMTEGQAVVAQRDFTNPNFINKIATSVLKQDSEFNLLNMDFFDAVKKIDWYDPYKYIKGIEGVKPLTESWNNFMGMFDLRHKIVHEMYDSPISLRRVAAMCDSTMNFIDATDFIFMIKRRKDVIERVRSKITLREKNAAIDRALDIAIAQGKIPPHMVKKILDHRAKYPSK